MIRIVTDAYTYNIQLSLAWLTALTSGCKLSIYSHPGQGQM